MPEAIVNGVRLSYEVQGTGDPVLLIMGSGARGRVWHAYQAPALLQNGYQVVTFDNRGTPPSEVPPGMYTLDEMVADTAGLIQHLNIAPCRVVGVSLGAFIAQELALARPTMVRAAVFMATRGRTDVVRRAYTRGTLELARQQIKLPSAYSAVVTALHALSPSTLNDDEKAGFWIEMFEFAADDEVSIGQLAADDFPDRLSALSNIRVPSLVVAFEDDLITPPSLGREVADAIPGCAYVALGGCGHFGYLEQPEQVNEALLRFFADT